MATWNPRANELFQHARELVAADERAAYLARECGDDVSLRAEIDALLAADQQASSFLESPAEHRYSSANVSAGQPGDLIGPYKLRQEIGEGGMGLVFMAEQTEPVRRTVALKIIKPGMDARQVVARFEAERQALALMDHPNIAKVLDGGTTAAGLPYFVMELVKGMPLTRYCDEKRLTLEDRLRLFIPVCQAVQHAHQKGIIHRDLKPSNVLAALYDGRPVPKVIDFGVAKATGPRLTERTMYTAYGTVIGTLEYMSPEQAELNQLDVDTRSDIYSLGVLLYELATGSTPLEAERARSATFDEARRIIRDELPARPSARLSSSVNLPALASQRGLEPRKLADRVRGDLDWIILKALEKDRARRYETANALARDLERFLAYEPIEARPPTTWYRLSKFVGRNRTLVTAAVLVVAALSAGIVGSVWQAMRATRAEQNALAQAGRAERAAEEARASRSAEVASRQAAEDRLRFLVTAVGIESRSIDPTTLPAQAMNESWERVFREFDVNPRDRAALLLMIGRSCFGMRRWDVAERELRECLALASDPHVIREAKTFLGASLLRLGKLDEGVATMNEGYFEHLQSIDNPDAAEIRAAWDGLDAAARNAVEQAGQDGLQLDGVDDYVLLPRLYFDGRPPWTIEAILRADELDQYPSRSDSNWTSLVSATDGGSIGLECNRRKWSLGLYTSIERSETWEENYASVFSKDAPILGEWIHLAGVWDGQELRLYLDGVLQEATRGVVICSSLSDVPFCLGADPANPKLGYIAEGLFHGRFRAVRISHGVEYTDNFASPKQLEKTPETLALYDFTVDTGRYAIDRSGHGHHGIIVGAKFTK